ncbi:MAG: VWA domain-containing protein [Pseudomonadota bacterium]
MARKRRFNVFSLSFLDIMSCGFGAVVLIFLIINHATEETVQETNRDILAELRMLDYQVLTGEKNLAERREKLDEQLRRLKEIQRQIAALESEVRENTESLADLDADTLAKIDSVEQLKSDLKVQEDEVKRLRAAQAESEGQNVREVVGEGDRQYLTGLKVGGKRILIAIDVSASMLDHSIVNVLRRRNMDDERKRAAPKWRRTVATTDWLAAQIPIDSQFQILTYNTEVDSLVTPGQFDWQEIDGPNKLNSAVERLRKRVPEGGTSLENLLARVASMSPQPDNLYLVADGLPTQGRNEPRAATVSSRRRMELFGRAVKQLPDNMTVNVIMFPMEGDPLAAAAYWNLAMVRGGAYLAPSRDWP